MTEQNTPPHIFDHLDEIRPFIQSARLGLILDFDGTLSEIVPIPEDAVIYPAAVKPLEGLTRKLAVVSIMSGRAANFIHEKVGIKSAVYVGNHGAESIINGRLVAEPQAHEHRETLESALDYLRGVADGPGIKWEDKGYSVAVHYRLAPDTSEARKRLDKAVESLPNAEHLEIFWGRMILEIRTPTGLNKGFALRTLSEDRNLESVIFVGDDTTDLDAMLALNELRDEEKLRGLNVLVVHENSSRELLDAADYSLNSVREVADFLKWLDEAID